MLIGVLMFVSMLSLIYLHSFSISTSLPVGTDGSVKTMIEQEHQLPDVALLKKMLQLVWEAFTTKI